MKTRFNYPTRIIFGQGVVDDIGEELDLLQSKRPLVITDKGLAKTGIPERILELIKKTSREAELFSDVDPNPVAAQVESGADAYRAHGADSIVALGGGSPMDTAKAVQIRINHPEPLEEYDDLLGGDARITEPLPSLIAIPTTAGTGSEVSRSAVITVDKVQRKVVLFSPRLMPAVAICDPELTYSVPPGITAETGMDALSHNLEAFMSTGYHPMADAIALKGVELISASIDRAVQDGKDVEARQQMMMASTMGAVAFQKGLGATHSLAHPLSSGCGLGHGLAISIMLPWVVRFNAEALGARAEKMAEALGARQLSAEGAAVAIEGFAKRAGLPRDLQRVGVSEADFPYLVEKAMEDGCHTTNPRECGSAEMEGLLRRALGA